MMDARDSSVQLCQIEEATFFETGCSELKELERTYTIETFHVWEVDVDVFSVHTENISGP